MYKSVVLLVHCVARSAAEEASGKMGLLTIIKKVKAKEKEMRLLMVGLDNAGKVSGARRSW